MHKILSTHIKCAANSRNKANLYTSNFRFIIIQLSPPSRQNLENYLQKEKQHEHYCQAQVFMLFCVIVASKAQYLI